VLAIIPITGAAPDTDPSGEASAVVEAIRHGVRTLRPGLGSARLAVGVSDPVLGGAALPGAVEQARHAHEQAVARPDQAIVVSCAELASHLLLLAGVPGPTRQAFRDRLLGPLLDYDRAHDADMVRTLDTFLSCSGSWNRTAALLHVHVNTLRYRIQRIEQITGRDLSNFADRVDFFLALRLH
jgi:sugar diacid utilization regulator